MKARAADRIVLAYSGELNSSVAIPWLIEERHADVVTVTLDLGQGRDLTDVRARALAAGARRAHVIDAREDFARGYILPALQAGVRCDGRFPLAPALARPLIARRLIDVARMERATAIAHGAVDGAHRSRLNVLLRSLDSSLNVLAPLPVCGWTLPEKLHYARTKRISIPGSEDIHAIDTNLWGRSVRGQAGSDAGYRETSISHRRSIEDCPDDPAYIEIEFDAGVPVRANRIDMPLLELIESVEVIAGAHGVGRVIPSRKVAHGTPRQRDEAPAAIVLEAAYRALERGVISRDLGRLKDRLGRVYADLIRDGLWFSPTREAIDAFVRTFQPRVTGSVVLKLLKGTCVVAAVNPSLSHVDAKPWPSGTAMAFVPASQGRIS